ncbi:class I SAM-dependent methyltransferase [Phyllobacterium sp. TAF24]|uniref:class I SAM-dependent methyltransferase n=1 Tax=Phyllobacterium sp. TAF24 TaxID=3233068 RepID=UPI003F970284
MWVDTIIRSAGESIPEAPKFPPVDVQERFVGRSGKPALVEVLPFIALIRKYARISNNTKMMDFGVGWGRIARFFQDAISEDTFYLADVDQEALQWCVDCSVKGNRVLLDPIGSLPMQDGTLDIIYSFSVFSHLSEASAKHWLNELHRVLKPGGVLIFTTQSMRFLHLVRACHAKARPNDIERSIGQYFGSNPQRAVDRYAEGKHTYTDVGGDGGGGVLSGEFYGWAAIPPRWVHSTLGGMFKVMKYIDNPKVQEQAIFVLKKHQPLRQRIAAWFGR